MPSEQLFSNNAIATVNVDINPLDTSISGFVPAELSLFASSSTGVTHEIVTLLSKDRTKIEIIKIVDRPSPASPITVERGVEGTVALSFTVADNVVMFGSMTGHLLKYLLDTTMANEAGVAQNIIDITNIEVSVISSGDLIDINTTNIENSQLVIDAMIDNIVTADGHVLVDPDGNVVTL